MFKEPLPNVLKKTILGAVGGALLFTWILIVDSPVWLEAIANFLACFCLAFGGHFLERFHIRFFEPKLISHPVENRTVRIMIWILGGGVLVQISILVWKIFGISIFNGISFWMGGTLFTLFQLAILHPVMGLLRLNNFYNNKG